MGRTRYRHGGWSQATVHNLVCGSVYLDFSPYIAHFVLYSVTPIPVEVINIGSLLFLANVNSHSRSLCRRPSVCLSVCLSVTFVRPILKRLKFFSAIFLRHLVPSPSVTSQGNLPSGAGVKHKYSDF